MLQGSLVRFGNKIYFLPEEVIVLAQWTGQKLQYFQLQTGWREAL